MDLHKWGLEAERTAAAQLAARPPPFAGDGKRPVWSIDTPPPYPSGKWHIGAVAGYALIDVIARAKRMEGFDVLFPWGVDRNGINIEFAIEKKHKKRMQDWDRAAFLAACEAAIAEFSDDIVRIGQRIGLSCDFSKGYATDSPEYRAFSQACFLELFEKGLIVEDLRPNAYDAKLGTAIADAEVFYEERKTKLNHVVWTVQETGEAIQVSTTRPELVCACRAILVHPDHAPTKHLVGKRAVLPVERSVPPGSASAGDRAADRAGDAADAASVPILAHPHVKTDFGSGIMMVCSYGDQADVQLFRELSLDPIAAVGLDGRMTEAAAAYRGLTVEEARAKVLEDLRAAGRLAGQDEVMQKFPVSERSKAPVEIVLLKEWYVKQTHCASELRDVARRMEFHPAKHRQLLLDWIDTVTIDWPISRRRWYHTEIPLWTVLDEQGRRVGVVVPPHDLLSPTHPYHQPWRQDAQPPPDSRVHLIDGRAGDAPIQDLRDLKPAGTWADHRKANPRARLVGESKVFDTWMDSSVSNLYILAPHRGKPWAREHTCSVRPQGRDIVRTWLYYTTLKSWLLEARPAFSHCWIHGMGMDKHGRKMSKSLGNVIDPDSILEKHGSDAFRLWIASECTVGDDFRIDEQKIQGTGKFLQKLANVVGFVARFEQAKRPAKLHPADTWILGELDRVRATAVEGYAALDFFAPSNAVRSFVWNLLAPHYVEMTKERAYGGDASACWTLHECVRRVLLMLAPVCPFFAHHHGSAVYGLDVHAARFPEPLGIGHDPTLTERIEAFNAAVWKAKKDQGISLAAPIHGIEVPKELESLRDVLVAMHRLGLETPA